MEATAQGNIIIKNFRDRLEIIIPSKGNLWTTVFLVAIVIFWWFTGADMTINYLLNSKPVEPSDWVWLAWGMAVILVMIRNAWNRLVIKEIITIKNGALFVRKYGSLFARTKKYQLAQAKRFRIAENKDDSESSIWGNYGSQYIGTGIICFDYNKKIIRFGEGLSAGEGNYILQVLKDKQVIGTHEII